MGNFKKRIDILGSDSKIVTTVEASQPINDTRLRPGDSPFFQRNIQIKTNTSFVKTTEEFLNGEIVFIQESLNEVSQKTVSLWATENQFVLDPLQFQISSLPN